jgi:hypothetical protein
MPRTTSTGWLAGSWELPVLVALARIDRTGIPAAHGDDHISGADRLVGKGLGEGPGQVDAHLGLAHAEGGCSTVLEVSSPCDADTVAGPVASTLVLEEVVGSGRDADAEQ